ncbi:hypothetical protein N8D56_13890 [Devosia sp. A8/3-2]|nr:hypothetical protein N8D56_13890 [Devosia sp. A8/3-2]
MYINTDGKTVAQVLAEVQTHMQGRPNAAGSTVGIATVAPDAGKLQITMPANSGFTMSASTSAGLSTSFTTTPPISSVPNGTPVNAISANQNAQFLTNTIPAGSITVYAQNGAPAEVTMRWAKVDSATSTPPGTDTGTSTTCPTAMPPVRRRSGPASTKPSSSPPMARWQLLRAARPR